MNTSPYVDPNKSSQEVWEEFSMSFTPAVREVVEFAKSIPSFRDLPVHDQVCLLKAGTFEVRGGRVLKQNRVFWIGNRHHRPGRANISAPDSQVLMVRFASLFNLAERTVTFLSGKRYSLDQLRALGAGELISSMCEFSEKLAALRLSEEELRLFTAVVLVSAGKMKQQQTFL